VVEGCTTQPCGKDKEFRVAVRLSMTRVVDMKRYCETDKKPEMHPPVPSRRGGLDGDRDVSVRPGAFFEDINCQNPA
jgi:hypothetical protein